MEIRRRDKYKPRQWSGTCTPSGAKRKSLDERTALRQGGSQAPADMQAHFSMSSRTCSHSKTGSQWPWNQCHSPRASLTSASTPTSFAWQFSPRWHLCHIQLLHTPVELWIGAKGTSSGSRCTFAYSIRRLSIMLAILAEGLGTGFPSSLYILNFCKLMKKTLLGNGETRAKPCIREDHPLQ